MIGENFGSTEVDGGASGSQAACSKMDSPFVVRLEEDKYPRQLPALLVDVCRWPEVLALVAKELLVFLEGLGLL